MERRQQQHQSASSSSSFAWQKMIRAVALLLASFCTLGANGAHEIYNVLQPTITKPPNCTEDAKAADCQCSDCLGIGDQSYNEMFTIMFWSSALVLTVTGLLLDKLGNWLIVPILLLNSLGTSLIAVGGSVFAGSSGLVPTIFVGSALMGIGYLPSIVARDRIISLWFRGSEIGIAFGISSCINRLASLVTFIVTEPLRSLLTLQVVLWLAAIYCFASLFCGVVVVIIDRRRSRGDGDNNGDDDKSESSPPRLSDLLNMGTEYWLLLVINVLCFTIHNTLQDNLTEFVHDTKGRSKFSSALIGGSVHYIGIVVAPASGFIVDRLGRPVLSIAVAAVTLVPCLSLLAFSSATPLPVILVTGTCTCFLYVSVIGSITLVVSRPSMGTALACCFCASTVFCGIVHECVGRILGWEHRLPSVVKAARWQSVLSVVLGLCCAMLATSLLLACVSVRSGSRLSIARWQKRPAKPVEYDKVQLLEESDSDLTLE